MRMGLTSFHQTKRKARNPQPWLLLVDDYYIFLDVRVRGLAVLAVYVGALKAFSLGLAPLL